MVAAPDVMLNTVKGSIADWIHMAIADGRVLELLAWEADLSGASAAHGERVRKALEKLPCISKEAVEAAVAAASAATPLPPPPVFERPLDSVGKVGHVEIICMLPLNPACLDLTEMCVPLLID